jgi:hypothetical protein
MDALSSGVEAACNKGFREGVCTKTRRRLQVVLPQGHKVAQNAQKVVDIFTHNREFAGKVQHESSATQRGVCQGGGILKDHPDWASAADGARAGHA